MNKVLLTILTLLALTTSAQANFWDEAKDEWDRLRDNSEEFWKDDTEKFWQDTKDEADKTWKETRETSEDTWEDMKDGVELED